AIRSDRAVTSVSGVRPREHCGGIPEADAKRKGSILQHCRGFSRGDAILPHSSARSRLPADGIAAPAGRGSKSSTERVLPETSGFWLLTSGSFFPGTDLGFFPGQEGRIPVVPGIALPTH